jgi:hypothetical protein
MHGRDHTTGLFPPPCGVGLGVGSVLGRVHRATTATPLPNPPPSQVGLARLAHHIVQPGQTRAASEREPTRRMA